MRFINNLATRDGAPSYRCRLVAWRRAHTSMASESSSAFSPAAAAAAGATTAATNESGDGGSEQDDLGCNYSDDDIEAVEPAAGGSPPDDENCASDADARDEESVVVVESSSDSSDESIGASSSGGRGGGGGAGGGHHARDAVRGAKMQQSFRRLDLAAFSSAQERDRSRPALKTAILGEYSVGKTSLLQRFINNTFSFDVPVTVGLGHLMTEVRIRASDGSAQTVPLNVWDTAGQEHYHSLTSIVLHDLKGVLIVFALDNLQSYQCAQTWVQNVRDNCDNPVIVLVGNKLDLIGAPATGASVALQQAVGGGGRTALIRSTHSASTTPLRRRCIETDAARRYARTANIDYIEVSALRADGVTRAFEMLAERVLERETASKSDSTALAAEAARRNGIVSLMAGASSGESRAPATSPYWHLMSEHDRNAALARAGGGGAGGSAANEQEFPDDVKALDRMLSSGAPASRPSNKRCCT